MKIKEVSTVEDVMSLWTVEDDVEDVLHLERGEWIQWLMAQFQQEFRRVHIWTVDKGGKIVAYVVVLNSVVPPVSSSVAILYMWSLLDVEEEGLLLSHIKKWAKERRASTVTVTVKGKDVKKYSEHGFSEQAIIMGLEV